MKTKSKLKQNRILCILFLTCLCVIVENINFQQEDYGVDQLDNLSLNAAPLYHLEWSRIDSSLGVSWDLAMSSSEDIYMVCDGPSSGKSTVIKYDKNGNFQWESSIDGEFRSIALDVFNYVYIAGRTSAWDMILAKFSSSGVFQWSKTYSVRNYDIAYAVTVDSSNNVYIGGVSYVSGSWVNKDALLVKYSSSGTRLWERFLDLRDEDYIAGLTTDSSNNVYLTGHHRLYSTTDDIFIAKYSSSGTFQWSKNWGSIYDEEAYDIALDSANNIYVTGMAYDSITHEDLLLIKFNSAGNLQWSRKWVGYGMDRGYSIDLSSDGDIFIGGATYEQSAGLFDILLSVYNSAGTMKWWGRWGGSNHDTGRGIAVNPSKQVYIGGDRDDDLCLLKFEPAPSITINSPSPNSLYSFLAPSFDVDITDSNLIEKYYTVNDGSQYTFTGSTGNINQAAWDTCGNGTVSLKFYGRDASGSVYEEVIVRKDIIAPDFEIISPTTFQVCTDTAPNYQLTTSDTDVNAIWYTLNGGGNIVTSSLTGTIDQATWNTLDNGSVLIEFFLKDDMGNIASKSVEVYKNYEIHLISINSPLPNQFCGLKAPSYSISTFSLFSIDEMWYSLNGGQNITITETDGVIEQTEWDLKGNGTVTITFYANNSLGNVGNAEVTVRKDIYFPFIDIYAPEASQKYGISPPYYNVSITSVSLDSKWYSLNFGSNIPFLDDVGIIEKSEWDACGNGTVVITFYANNTGGISNSKEISIYKDIRCPNITIISPSAEILYGLETIDFSISIDEPELDKTWYSLNGGMNNSFVGTSGIIDQGSWDACGNGTVTISFYANNILGNIGFAEVIVHKDVYYPFITIISPESEQWCGISAPNYNVSVSSLDIDSMWYSLNDGINYTILTTTGTIDQLYWENYGDENITITFYANNSYGQLNFASVKIKKDITVPNVTIFSPQPFELFGIETIGFNVSITDPTLDFKWYTLNGGTKYFFATNYGIIDQTAWDTCGNGTVTIIFFANNSLGNIGYAEVTVHKDIYFPFLEIHEPINNQLVGPLAPSFNITVSSYAIDTMWYSLNYSTIGFFLEPEGMIDQSKWDLFEAGFITLTFYANNSYGQINFKEIVVEKAIEVIERTAYAIVIGISDYPGSNDDLNYCDDDAIAVYNMLIDDYNFKSENIIYLQDSSATKADIDNAFNTIASVINPLDIFFFYYSGHGGGNTEYIGPFYASINSPHPYPNDYDRIWSIDFPDAAAIRVHFSQIDLEYGWDYLLLGDTDIIDGWYYQELTGTMYNFWSDWIPLLNDNKLYLRLITDNIINGWGFHVDRYEVIKYDGTHYLCSYDSIPDNPSNYYLDTLLDLKLDSINCDEKYVVLDSCNSGGLIPEVQGMGRYMMTACKGGQFSMEEPAFNHGIFTYYLLDSLEKANDQNSDGIISLEECYSYVYSKTTSYSGSYGSGYRYHPQQYDGIGGQSVLYASIGSFSYNFVGNRLYYSFYLYGTGQLNTLEITLCSISPEVITKKVEIKNLMVSYTGFGYYSDFIELDENYNVTSFELLCEVLGNELITLKLSYGDTDGDGITDIIEILDGLDPTLNDTDSDGLSDYDEFYGPTDPLNDDTDSDGLLDGEEVNLYGTNPLDSDTDSDGLSDEEEVNIYPTDPLNADCDSDNLSDGDEINIHFTNPLNNDTDSDDLSDGIEINVYNTNPLTNDTDSDDLFDAEEIFIYNTDPLLNDTDSDGLSDYDEIFLYNTDPLEEDTDSDGLSDYDELNTHFTDPLNDDTDSDTIPDGWEVNNLLDPFTNDTALDPDNDSLTNLEEYQFNTQPFNNDTDSDGLLDGEEVNSYNTNPLEEDTDSDGLLDGEEVNTYNTDPLQEDTDSDGLLDGEEVTTYNTDPLNGDTDSDTMPDKWEVDNLLNPLVNDTALDPDNDLLINILEYQHSTDPQNPDTDGDEWTDGDEVLVYDTDPLDPDDHPSPRAPPAIPGYIFGLILLNMVVIATVYIIKSKRRLFKN